MMLSGPSLGTEHYKEATLFISRVLDEASISPLLNGVTGYKQRSAGREGVIDKERARDCKARDLRQSECF